MKLKGTIAAPIAIALFILAASGCQSDIEKATDHLARAQAYYDKEEYKAAAIELENAVKHNRSLTEAHYLRSKVAAHLQDWPNFHTALQKTVLHDSDHLQANTDLAELYLASNQPDRAQGHLDSAKRSGLPPLKAHLIQAAIYSQLGDQQGAYAETGQALMIDPTSTEATLLHGSLLLADKLYQPALDAVEKVIAESKQDIRAYNLRYQIYTAKGDLASAAEDLARLIAIDPLNLQYRVALSAIQLQIGDPAAAEQVLQKAVQELPQNTEAKLALARHTAHHKSPDQAIALLNSYIAENPAPKLSLALAELLTEQGNSQQAATIYRSLEESPDQQARLGALNKMAQAELKQNRFDEATALVDKVLLADPNNLEALLTRGFILFWQNRNDEALESLSHALRIDPKSEPGLLLTAKVHHQDNNAGQALELLSRLVALNLANADGVLLYAQLLTDQGKARPAIELLQAHSQYKPLTVQGKQLLVRLLLADRQFNTAGALATDLSREIGEPEYAAYIRAVISQSKGAFSESSAQFKKLLDSEQYQQEALTGLVYSQRQIGKSAENYRVLRQFIDRHPGKLFAAEILAGEYLVDEKYSDLEKAVTTELASNPDWRTGYGLLSEAQLRQGKWQPLIETCTTALKGGPTTAESVRFLMLKARAHLQLKQPQHAEKYYREVLQLDQNIDDAANNLAFLLTKDAANNPHRLQEAFEIASRFGHSDKPSYMDTLGWIYYLRGDYSRAKGLLENAVKQSPDNASIHYHLGATYSKLDTPGPAREHLEKFLSLNPDTTTPDTAAAKALLEELGQSD